MLFFLLDFNIMSKDNVNYSKFSARMFDYFIEVTSAIITAEIGTGPQQQAELFIFGFNVRITVHYQEIILHVCWIFWDHEVGIFSLY